MRGANVIERHFTLNKKMEGPDHILSSDKKEMQELTKYKKFYNKWNELNKLKLLNKKDKINLNLILGDGIKKIQPNEYITINSQKKCLYARKKINMGQKIKLSDIEVKGPAGEFYQNTQISSLVEKQESKYYKIIQFFGKVSNLL